jgi:hypothetical protein
MNNTQRGLLPALPAGYAQVRRAEEAERRWKRKLPPWGQRSPVTGLWTMPERSARGDKLGFWERNPADFGIVAHDVHPEAASWTKVPFSRTPRQSSGLSAFDRRAAIAVGSGRLSAEPGTAPTPDDEAAPGPRRYGRDAVVGTAPDRTSWEASQQLPAPPQSM